RGGVGGAGEHQRDPPAAVLTGAESGGESVALPPFTSRVQPRGSRLRGPGGRGRPEPERRLPRCGQGQKYLQCSRCAAWRMNFMEAVLAGWRRAVESGQGVM